jgi:hypothetical protein
VRSLHYYLTVNGTKVHHIDCKYAVGGVVWKEAEGFTPGMVAEFMSEHPVLKACKECRPHSQTGMKYTERQIRAIQQKVRKRP